MKKIQKKYKKVAVVFIAMQFENKPITVNYYTKSWDSVPTSQVKKIVTKKGPRFYTYIPA